VIPRRGPPDVLEVREAPDPVVNAREKSRRGSIARFHLPKRPPAQRYIHERRNIGKVLLVP